MDYELICTYLEEEENFQNLFGSGSQTTVGPGCMTRAQAFEKFAQYMNVAGVNLNLSGSQMRQRFDTYKNKYRKAKDFERNTGAGIEEQEGYHSLHQKLEGLCPCFD